jgi:hypothetical protein
MTWTVKIKLMNNWWNPLLYMPSLLPIWQVCGIRQACLVRATYLAKCNALRITIYVSANTSYQVRAQATSAHSVPKGLQCLDGDILLWRGIPIRIHMCGKIPALFDNENHWVQLTDLNIVWRKTFYCTKRSGNFKFYRAILIILSN